MNFSVSISVTSVKTRSIILYHREGALWCSVDFFSKGSYFATKKSAWILCCCYAVTRQLCRHLWVQNFGNFRGKSIVCADSGQTCWCFRVGPVWDTTVFSDIDNSGNCSVAMVYKNKGCLALQDPRVCAQMHQLHKAGKSKIWTISNQQQWLHQWPYQWNVGMTALVHNSSVDGDDQGNCQKTFSERQCSWFPGGQAIWVNTAAVSLFSISLSTSCGSRWKWATTVQFRKYCCFGRLNSLHFHRETTKIQGWSCGFLSWFLYS